MKKLSFIAILFVFFFALSTHAEPSKRVVTIGGALTEIVFALEAGDLLVGNDTTSYYPEAAKTLPKVGYQRALSAEGILSLDPDLIILSEEAGPPAVLNQLKSAGTQLLSLKAPRNIEEIIHNIETIAALLQRRQQAAVLIESIKKQYQQLQSILAQNTKHASVLFVLQHGGGLPMVAGKNTSADSIMKLSGVENIISEFQGYKPLTPEAAALLQPDFILLTEQGLEQAGGKKAFLNMPGISLTPAAEHDRIIIMDSLLLLGFGPRTMEAALALNSKVTQFE